MTLQQVHYVFKGHRNAAGFLAFYTCPGATQECMACCYTEGGQAGMPIAKDFRAQNTHALLQLCRRRAVRKLSDQLGCLMDDAHAQYERRLAKASDRELRRLRRGSLFRHNWSGDLLDETHATALHRCTEARPHIQTWVYTRSFHLLPLLDPPPPNMTVWLSDDRDNWEEAEKAQQRYPWSKRATLVERWEVAGSDLICPKLRYRDGETTTALAATEACPICRICAKPSDKVERVVFPEKHHSNFQPPAAEMLRLHQIEELRIQQAIHG